MPQLSDKARDYARTMHGPAYRAFVSWCRNPQSSACESLARILDDYTKSDKPSHKAASVLRVYANGGIGYDEAWSAVVRAIVIQDLI